MRIRLSRLPDYPRTYAADFPRLSGGLNLRELNYRLSADQSPGMKNLWWERGVLQSRNGQEYLSADETLGAGFACYEGLFWDHAFFHIGAGLYCAPLPEDRADFALTEVLSGVPENAGTFFRYGDSLYYKNRGGFFRVDYAPEESGAPFTAGSVLETAAVPVTLINADPETGAGDLYQPENRLSPRKTVRYTGKSGVSVYRLPVSGADAVTAVTVDGAAASYTASPLTGTVTFPAAPAAGARVEITYEKANPEAMSAVMDCNLAFVAGGDQSLCVLLAGCPAQPNAVFWNGNDAAGMRDDYFPMSFYNFVGDTEDAVTGFGRQYADLIVFKSRGVGKLLFGVEEVNGRNSVSFTFQSINARIGCDLPGSIQLIENNLVFANTRSGVHVLRSASAAYENNIECLSENVNGSGAQGLLADTRGAASVCSMDDGSRYWLCAGSHVYLWDYAVSTLSKPAWFYFTKIPAAAFFQDGHGMAGHLDSAGRITRFARTFSDYGGAIDKVYTFPTQYFGSYVKLKDVTDLLITVRSDTDTVVSLRYATDYETRTDLTPITSYVWKLFPRDLSRRSLSAYRYGKVARRRPQCRHIRHFSLSLSNNRPGEDLAIVSAQILYRFTGRER